MAQDVDLPKGSEELLQVAKRWRRFLAVLVDGLIIFLPLMAGGLAFYDKAVALGDWGRLIGVAATMLYFGALDSRIGGGQTPGKRLLKVKVMRTDGELLSPVMAALRAAILLLPFYLNGLPFPDDPRLPLWADLILTLQGALVLSIIYLFIFNRSRRSLHDLLTGAVVIDARGAQVAYTRPLWRGHQIATALIFVAAIGIAVAESVWPPAPNPAVTQMKAVRRTVMAIPGVRQTGVQMQSQTVTMLRSGTSHQTFFLVLAVMEAQPANPEGVARQIEDAVFSAHSDVFGPINVLIVVRHGFDFGFATASSDFKLMTSVAQWQARTKQRTL